MPSDFAPQAYAHLVAALAEQFRFERELGRGGMATVFLVEDLRHARPVALKVLHPELATTLGADRFLREIRIAARLRHPHILPMLDSGETSGFLWYSMPFVDGETLRQRLARKGALPIDEALRITEQVLGALGHAHTHGVVHRDIKPENILLEGNDAVVADFGVSRAFSSANDERLTETGITLGTPAYMSPEQATASKELDGRSDLYATGCVLYEMLAGQPPFVGANPQQLVARHLLDTPPSLRIVRPTVPDGVERGVMRALAKMPADRFETAAAFATALAESGRAQGDTTVTSVTTTPLASPASPAPMTGGAERVATRVMPGLSGVRRHARTLAIAVMASVVLTAAIVFLRRPTHTVDPNVVAVMPFRVGGASPALAYLREGMIDLVAARLTGEGSARAADPSSVMAAWRRAATSEASELPEGEALDLARSLGAGQLLLGSIVGTPNRVTISASLVRVQGATPRVVASVEGVPDSLPQLIDQLVARLLTAGSGLAQGPHGLANTPLAALRHYLEGRAEMRRARYAEAVVSFGRALDIDSTFAIAGLHLATAAGWSAAPGAGRRGLQLAWASRDKLTASDRALVTASLGPNYPETSTLVQHVRAWEQAVALAPEQADRWYELGDVYFHEEPYLVVASSRQRAADAFGRAIALDSSASSIGHLLEIAVLDGDSGAVRRLGAMYLAKDSSGRLLDFYRWRIALGVQDTAALRALRSRYRGMPLESLWRIMNHAVLDGRAMEDADSAAAAIRGAAAQSADRQRSKTYLHAFDVNRGRPAAALADTAAEGDTEYGPHAALYERVIDALYGDGDRSSGEAAARELGRLAEGPTARAGVDRLTAMTDLCVATLWQLAHGETASAARAIARLRARAPGDDPQQATAHGVCATLLEAKALFATGAAGAPRAIDRLDSLMHDGPGASRNGPPVAFTLSPAYVRSMIGISPVGFEDFANLEIARMRERQGKLGAALNALRRRTYAYHLSDYLTATLRERGRIAALAGERAEAIAAYRHYLALRSSPEAVLQRAADSVRAELARLEGAH